MSNEKMPCDGCIVLPICLIRIRNYYKQQEKKLYNRLDVTIMLSKDCKLVDNYIITDQTKDSKKFDNTRFVYSYERMFQVGTYIRKFIL